MENNTEFDDELSTLTPEAQALFDMFGNGTPSVTPSVPLVPDSEKTPEQRILEQFDKEINEWGVTINSMTSRMRDIGKCIDVQMDLYDNRHNIVDRKHKLLRDLSKFNKKLKEKYAERLKHYTTGYDRKLTAGEREKMAEADVAVLKYNVELLENHINHIDQTFKLIENMIFGLQHRIKLEEYLRKL